MQWEEAQNNHNELRVWRTKGELIINWWSLSAEVDLALFFGGLIGLERQWRERSTGLRTNGLVAVGAARFVIMGGLLGGHDSQVHVAAYLVSGIGFLSVLSHK